MSRRPLALLCLLATACGEPPPPPKPPPTLQERIDASKARLQRLAEEQLAADPKDARLQLWVAAFKNQDIQALPASPLQAVVRCSWSPSEDEAIQAVETADPKSSYGPLFKAYGILRKARGNPGAWREATVAVEEALQRNQWDCPVEAFQAWALEWLEKNEPDAAVRACYRHRYVNLARSVLPALASVAEGLAFAPGIPKLDARRPADVLRRLVEERFLKSPSVADVLAAHAVFPIALEAQFLLAWRQKDLDTCRSASLALEEWGRRDAALKGWLPTYRSRRSLEDTITGLIQDGSLRPPFATPLQVKPAEATPEQIAWRKESLKEIQAGAKAYGEALRADARAKPILPELEGRRPPQSPKRNYLGYALRDREFLFTDPFPKDRHAQLLDVAFDGDNLRDPQAAGLEAYAWVIRDNLVRPASLPSAQVQKRFGERPGPNMDVHAVLRLRKENANVRPDLAEVRKKASPSSLHGYALLLADVVKTKPADALEWLPEPEGPTPSGVEVMLADTLRSATGKDFGPDWARWKTFLETGN